MKSKPWFFLFLLILFLVPFMGGSYLIYVLSLALVYLIAAIGLDILMGYAGQICFGQAGFVAVGAYVTVLLVKKGLSYWMSLPLGAIFAALAGLMIGLPALRIRGHYLALATMSFGYIIHLILVHWEDVTGGPRGLVATRSIWPAFFQEDRYFYLIIAVISVALFIVARNIVKSKYGRSFLAIQKDEIVSKSMGINLTKYKTLAFIISSFYGGIAGGLYGPLIGFLDPLSFTILDSGYYVMMIVLGGRGTLFGVIFGAAFFTLLPEVLRRAQFYQELFFGLIFICFLIFMPTGVMGFIRKYGPPIVDRIGKIRWVSSFLGEGRSKAEKFQALDSPAFSADTDVEPEKGFSNGFLRIHNLSISFGGLQALRSVSFDIQKGQVFSLIGPNGAGKTTTLNIITRLYEPNGGSVIFKGEELLKVRADRICHKGISRTFQNVGLFQGLTALENVMVGLHALKGSGFFSSAMKLKGARQEEDGKRARAMETLKLVHMKDQAFKVAVDLPFGQQKLVGLARALISEPHLLILDEPASGLSPLEIEQLMNLIRGLCRERGTTILLVEHDMRVVMGISDRIAVLNFGEKIAEGKPEEIQGNPLVVEAYLGEEEKDLPC